MSKAGLLGRIATLASMKKVMTVHSYHGHVLDGYFNKLFAQLIIAIEKVLGVFTDAFVFDGNQTLVEINDYGIRPKKIQQMILPGLIRNTPMRNRRQGENHRLRILVVARIEKVKRIDLVLSVARHLIRNNPSLNFEIIIVGDGELRKLFENQSKNELLKVKFVGWVDNVTEYYQNTDLLLSTSDSEGTPISFMEAASFGCPIISTNVGSVADLVDHRKTGILCENDAETIAREISNLWANQALLQEYSQSAQIKASSDFTLDKFLSKHADLYRTLIN
jgi:glycosyltransferase involved in cell wall biosynthesis